MGKLLIVLLLAISVLGGLASAPDQVSARPSGCSLSVGTPKFSSDGKYLYGTASATCSTAKYTKVHVCIYSNGALFGCNERFGTFVTNSVSTGCYWTMKPFAHVQMWGWVYWPDGTTSSGWGSAIYDRRRC